MLEVGTKAPALELPDQNGVIHTLEEYKDKVKAADDPEKMLGEV